MKSYRLLGSALLWTGALAVFCFAQGCFSGGAESKENSLDEASCPISAGADMFEVMIGFDIDNGVCQTMDVQVVGEKILVNAEKSLYEIHGQYVIDNDNVFYLRGPGLSEAQSCFVKMAGVGAYRVRAEFLNCTTKLIFDVVVSEDVQAVPFCRIHVDTGLDCVTNDDTGDDGHGDVDEECVTTLGDNIEACFSGVTSEEVCADPDADCWVACFNASESCGDWQDCLESSCGVVFE